MKKLLFLLLSISTAHVSFAAVADHVTQDEITWSFDKPYTVGQFANGDWWVLGPVVVTAITPDYRLRDFWDFTVAKTKGVVLHQINGWQVNPSTGQKQGFDATLHDFDSTLVPALPYTAAAGTSIVKAVSDTNPASPWEDHLDLYVTLPDTRMVRSNLLRTAAVLTVVGAVPPDSGRTVFRPPYVGTDRPYYSTNDLDVAALPSLAPVTDMPSMDSAFGWVQRVQLTHRLCPYGGQTRPSENIPSYSPVTAARNDRCALRLMMNDPTAQKMPLLIAFVQYGIDVFYFIKNEPGWPGTGYGVEPGHKMPLVFAARLLNNKAMADTATSHSAQGGAGLSENCDITLTQTGIAVWGGLNPYATDQERDYWNFIMNAGLPNAGSAMDPYGYVDVAQSANSSYEGYLMMGKGGEYKGEALVAMLVPGMKAVWGRPDFFQFVDRWVNHGVLTQPDPCAPAEGTWQGGTKTGRCTSAQDTVGDADKCIPDSTKYKITYGPDPNRHGDCIRDTDPSDGIGRFPLNDAKHADSDVKPPYQDNGYRSSFADYMWQAYRAQVPVAGPSISPNGGTFSGVVDVTLTPDVSSYGVALRYTTDASDPTTSSALYRGPVRLRTSCTFKARAFFGSYTPSAVVQASFTIAVDTIAPVVSNIITKQDSTKVAVVFSELVDSVTARTAANYTISKGITVLSATMIGNGPSVVLFTSAMLADTVYSLSVKNVKDLSGNIIAPNTQKQFTFVNFDPAVGLTGYWPFNTDVGTVAKEMSGYSIGNSYNGTVVGAVWTQGRIGQGLKFSSAADSVTLPDAVYSFGMDEANAFTIAFWVKITGHNAAVDPIIEHNGSVWGDCPYSIRVTNDRHIQTNLRDASTLNSDAVLNDSAWYHVALTYHDSARMLYINGVKDQGGSDKSAVDLYFPNDRITIFGHGLIGILDEVRFYNRALSASQIAHLAVDTTLYGSSFAASPRRIISNVSLKIFCNRLNSTFTIRLPNLYGPARIDIYSLSGAKVASFRNVQGEEIVWNAAKYSSGVYLVNVKAGDRVLTRRIQLIR